MVETSTSQSQEITTTPKTAETTTPKTAETTNPSTKTAGKIIEAVATNEPKKTIEEAEEPEELFISKEDSWCPIVDRAPWPHVSAEY